MELNAFVSFIRISLSVKILFVFHCSSRLNPNQLFGGVKNRRLLEKNHLTTHKYNLACFACDPSQTQTHSGKPLHRSRMCIFDYKTYPLSPSNIHSGCSLESSRRSNSNGHLQKCFTEVLRALAFCMQTVETEQTVHMFRNRN